MTGRELRGIVDYPVHDLIDLRPAAKPVMPFVPWKLADEKRRMPFVFAVKDLVEELCVILVDLVAEPLVKNQLLVVAQLLPVSREKEPVLPASPRFIEAKQVNEAALARYRKCLYTGHWPTSYEGTRIIS